MTWTKSDIDRLYELYQLHVRNVQTDVVATNRVLGATNPERIKLQELSRAEFEVLVYPPHRDLGAAQSWLRRIIRGHEQEFPGLELASQPMRRATGT